MTCNKKKTNNLSSGAGSSVEGNDECVITPTAVETIRIRISLLFLSLAEQNTATSSFIYRAPIRCSHHRLRSSTGKVLGKGLILRPVVPFCSGSFRGGCSHIGASGEITLWDTAGCQEPSEASQQFSSKIIIEVKTPESCPLT